jgi:hypothetical protein
MNKKLKIDNFKNSQNKIIQLPLNYNFAVKGVPAIDFAPGVKAFDEELMKYYHQQEDEVESLDFEYLTKYFRSYVYANYLLANLPKPPFWKPGDKFEEAGKKLYSTLK